MAKNPPAMQETRVQSLHEEDPLEKGMATPSSILAWRIHGWRSLVGSKSQTRLSNLHCTVCSTVTHSRSPACSIQRGHCIIFSFPFIIPTKRILILKTSVPMYLPSLLFFPSSSRFIPKSNIHCCFKSTTNFHLDVRVLEIQTLHQAEPVNFHSGYSGSFPKAPSPEHTC